MSALPSDLRNKLEKTIISARNLAEKAAKSALEAMAVQHHEPYGHMTPGERKLRNHLRARARQVGDTQDTKGILSIKHLSHECAYEHWHRMLFARFLAENNLLIEPDAGVAISLDECKELAKEAKTDLWTLAGQYAQRMLPQIFRADDPLLQVTLAKEDELKLEHLVDGLPSAVYTASDALGWCYQFWQTEKKKQVNESGVKIGADELPAVTQLFTEDYMVDFLLDNTLGAWWACKVLASDPRFSVNAKTEEELRKAVSLPGVEWKYLRFVKGEEGKWLTAAGTYVGWPQVAKDLKCLDPCMGSGHFIVAMFDRLVALRTAEENLSATAAVESVILDNLYGLEIDQRCTQLAAFNLALAAWRRVGYRALPTMHLACSGLGITAKKDEWLSLAKKSDKLRAGMERLYQLFRKAPVLGSLINPRLDGDLLTAEFNELQPLLELALKQEITDEAHELTVTAKGIADAANILAGQYTLVATNVPYLGRNKQNEVLMIYCDAHHPFAKVDLSTCFVERCLLFCVAEGSTAIVTPQNWLFLDNYKKLRQHSFKTIQWDCVARLGAHAFETIDGEVVSVALLALTKSEPAKGAKFTGIDVVDFESPGAKATALLQKQIMHVSQEAQLGNPDARFSFNADSGPRRKRLGDYVTLHEGMSRGDTGRFDRTFWEIAVIDHRLWSPLLNSPVKSGPFEGREFMIKWEQGKGALASSDGARLTGYKAWGKKSVFVARTKDLRAVLDMGEIQAQNGAVLLPNDTTILPALWAFCSSPEFSSAVREYDQKIIVASGAFLAVPFDLAYWQKVAAKKYPHGLPKPHSNDPTQWLFNGHPQGSEQPLHVAVARLLGYQWPRQTGSSFPDCPALKPDGLEKLADKDGIVCIPSVRGEEPAADRLRKMLAVSYGREWKQTSELELIRQTGSNASDLDEWLRNEFFEQHCDLFHQRPFIWHIWDGRKRDGFHALVNYHKLGADGGKSRKTLETLTHSYLNDWISRQKDGVKREKEGAEERLASALELKKRLEAIIDGEPPFDLFVRWKPISEQAHGWEPDINDGVRMNIRPFLASDLPNGKKGAGIMRSKPNVKWDKDRGNEPERPKSEYPWFWNGTKYTGDRLNDVHLTHEQKRKTKKS